jgi:nitrite reductase/ring-hydroxylating ferredoxin subunit/uncharacterized membrane protein
MDTRPDQLAARAAEALERQDRLQPIEEGLQRAVAAVFRAGGRPGRAVKNFLHGTWLGHPLHPVLTDVPLGAWTVALVCDVLDTRDGRWSRPADGAVGIGVAGAVAAAVSGLTDWQHTEGSPRRAGLGHAVLNTLALGLYVGSLAMRRTGARRGGRRLAGAGFAVVIASAYLGGRLVFHHRIGVDHAQRDGEQEREFERMLPEASLREGQPQRVDVRGVGVVLVRHQGRIYALGERCSHLGGPLAEGSVDEGGLACPWHGSRFALADGRVLDGPATMPQPCFDVRVRDGHIEVRRRHGDARSAA